MEKLSRLVILKNKGKIYKIISILKIIVFIKYMF